MLTRYVMPILQPRGEVAEEWNGIADGFCQLSKVLLDTAASAGRIVKPFAASREL